MPNEKPQKQAPKYDNELRGALWAENQSEVINRGHLQIEGEKRYCVLIQSVNDRGEKKHELCFSAGLVHPTSASEKRSPESPDIGGRVTIDGKVYKFGGWTRTTNQGLGYYSGSLRPISDEAPF